MKMTKPLLLSSLISFACAGQEISGYVTDRSGAPVADAKIEIVATGKVVEANAQGFFSVNSKSTQTELHIHAEGYSHKSLKWANTPLKVVLVESVIEQIDVVGSPIHTSNLESASAVNVIAGDNLKSKNAATLGETLKAELGVHSSYFGPVASSPIIRGLDGPRVMIAQNGLDVSDASRVGPDHLVSTETVVAKQVEVLRGPATLIYGSGAIGGVVNIVDQRVTTSSEFEALAELGYNSVANEEQGSFSINTGTEKFAFHADGFWRDGEDYEIPENPLEEDHDDHDDHDEEHNEEEFNGVLDNTAAKASGFNVGASYLVENGYVGFSYGRLDREYGIPGHSHGHEEAHEDGEHDEDEHEEHADVKGDLEQDRWQVISELTVDSNWVSKINSRLAYTDYQHIEIEDGDVGTTFANQTWQIKSDIHLAESEGWRSAITLEFKDTDFEAVGEEAFTPASNTQAFGLAYMAEKHFDDVLIQFGGRIEDVELTAVPFYAELGEHHDEHHDEEHEEEHHDEHEEEEHHEDDPILFDKQAFNPFSLSLGAVWDFAEGYNLGVSFTHAQRAPSAAELFSFGPHIGTSTFEVGALFELHQEEDEYHFDLHTDVKEEKSNNIDLSLRKFEGDIGFIVSVFYNQVDDYYYQKNTGLFGADGHDHEEHEEAEEGLPIYVFQQDDVELYGFEAELIWQATDSLQTRFMTDYTRAKLDNGGNLPRIPPMRVGANFDYRLNDWQAKLNVMHYFKQDDVAEMETATDAYTMVDVDVNYRFYLDSAELNAYLKVNNLTDEAARVHSSFLKEKTLLPGRGIQIGVRGYF